VEQSTVAILRQNEMVNEPCPSDLMRIYNLDIAPPALFELRRRVGLQGEFTKSADVIYK
jgi:hypothetical protein